MKRHRRVYLLLALTMLLSLSACSIQPAGNTGPVSGFDPSTNKTVRIGGIAFSYPAYFDVCETDDENYKHYYPESEEYVCSLIFTAEDATGTTQEMFEKNIEKVAGEVLERQFPDAVEKKASSVTIGGIPGWSMSCRDGDSEHPSTVYWTVVFNSVSETIVAIILIYDDDDISNSDYAGDYQKTLNSARLVPTSETSKPASGIRPEFKEAMDAYEAFFDEYCEIMEEYKKNPTNLAIMSRYFEMLAKAEEMDEAFEKWDEDEMSSEELKYYLEVYARVMQKLADVAD